MTPLAVPGRIAFLGDVHMNGPWTRQVVEHAIEQHADVVIQLGDFGYTFSASFLIAVETVLAKVGIPLLFVDGNHEAFPILLNYPIGHNGLRKITNHIWHLPRGFRWEWGDVRFLALGGAYSVDRPWRVPGKSWWRDEGITPGDVAVAIAEGPADVLISHDCPTGVTIPGIDDCSGQPPFPLAELVRANEHRQLLRQVVDAVQPRAIWHGHYHVDYSATVDLGYGPVLVTGLDCDATQLEQNVRLMYLDELLGNEEVL